MKIALLMLLLFSSIAFAQDSMEDRVSDLKLWALLQGLMDGTTDDTLIEHLARHGFRVEKIQPLQEFVANGRQALHEQAKTDWKRRCSQRATLSKDRLVAELEDAERRYYAVLRGIIENLPLVLNDSELKTLHNLAAEKNITVVMPDHSGKVRRGEMPVDKSLDRTCELAAEGATS